MGDGAGDDTVAGVRSFAMAFAEDVSESLGLTVWIDGRKRIGSNSSGRALRTKPWCGRLPQRELRYPLSVVVILRSFAPG